MSLNPPRTFADICSDRVVRADNRMRKAYQLWKIMLDDNHPESDYFYEEYKMAESALEKAKDQYYKAMNS
jgi:hypothetical protein